MTFLKCNEISSHLILLKETEQAIYLLKISFYVNSKLILKKVRFLPTAGCKIRKTCSGTSNVILSSLKCSFTMKIGISHHVFCLILLSYIPFVLSDQIFYLFWLNDALFLKPLMIYFARESK